MAKQTSTLISNTVSAKKIVMCEVPSWQIYGAEKLCCGQGDHVFDFDGHADWHTTHKNVIWKQICTEMASKIPPILFEL